MAYVIDRPQLENRMKNLGFTYTFTSEPPSVLSQPAHSSNSMPRREARGRRHFDDRAPSADLAHARRKHVSSAVQDYLKSLNAMTRSIVLETESVEEDHRQKWSNMNVATREELVDDHFVPSGVRAQYGADARRQERQSRTRPRSADRLLRVPQGDGRTHLSQPTDWEEHETDDHLVMSNAAASWSNEGSLSQPSPYSYGSQHYRQRQPDTRPPQPEYKLHKRQPSLRSNHVVKPVVRPHPLPHPDQLPALHTYQPQSRALPQTRDRLGSDGESPRTSDEDSSVNGGYANPLGFNRTKMRSYSMRQKRGSLRNNFQQHTRSSTRLPHRVHRPEPTQPSHPKAPHQCPPRHVPDVAYDDEVDLPVESLLLDHVQGQNDSYSKPDRYSKNRHSQRTRPQIVVHHTMPNMDTVFVNNHTSGVIPDSATSFNTDTSSEVSHPVSEEPEVVSNRLLTSPSHDSLDIDSISIAPSNVSEQDYSRAMTPDSMLSGSTCSYRPNSKLAELAIMRNPRGKRGGSSYKNTTSEFADRHAQFKPNMLWRQRLTSSQNTPLSSTPVPPELSQNSSLLKPHPGLISPSKHRSLAGSEVSDYLCSPDHLSLLSSPPQTPRHVTDLLEDHRRESGYSSTGSSYESFPVRR